jgi:hypothetical protein
VQQLRNHRARLIFWSVLLLVLAAIELARGAYLIAIAFIVMVSLAGVLYLVTRHHQR